MHPRKPVCFALYLWEMPKHVMFLVGLSLHSLRKKCCFFSSNISFLEHFNRKFIIPSGPSWGQIKWVYNVKTLSCYCSHLLWKKLENMLLWCRLQQTVMNSLWIRFTGTSTGTSHPTVDSWSETVHESSPNKNINIPVCTAWSLVSFQYQPGIHISQSSLCIATLMMNLPCSCSASTTKDHNALYSHARRWVVSATFLFVFF